MTFISRRSTALGTAAMVLAVTVLSWQAFVVNPGPALAQYETPTVSAELTICHTQDDRRVTLTLPESEARLLLDTYEDTTLGPCSTIAPGPPDTGSGTSRGADVRLLAATVLFALGAFAFLSPFVFGRTR